MPACPQPHGQSRQSPYYGAAATLVVLLAFLRITERDNTTHIQSARAKRLSAKCHIGRRRIRGYISAMPMTKFRAI